LSAALGAVAISAVTLAFAAVESPEEATEAVRAVAVEDLERDAMPDKTPPADRARAHGEPKPRVILDAEPAPRVALSESPTAVRNLRQRLESTLEDNRQLTAALSQAERERQQLKGVRAEATALSAETAMLRRELDRERSEARELQRLRRALFAQADTTPPVVAMTGPKPKRRHWPQVDPHPPLVDYAEAKAKAAPAPMIAPRESAATSSQPGPAERAALRAGVEAYNAGDYEAAQEAWLPLAQGGYPWAQFLLGSLLYEGRTASATHETAEAWLSLAERHGVVEAIAILDELHLRAGAREATLAGTAVRD
jgi:TolA-binding protein